MNELTEHSTSQNSTVAANPEMLCISIKEAFKLGTRVLECSRVSRENAISVSQAVVRAEAQGVSSHGLARIPMYADQALSGMVDGFAKPSIHEVRTSSLLIDACTGFAFPALDAGLPVLVDMVRQTGVAAAVFANSHHFGIAGDPVAFLARRGFLGIALSSASPPAIAPWGGSKALMGTNPMAFACPRKDAEPVVVDISMSKWARGRIIQAARLGQEIPEGVAKDSRGVITRDPNQGLVGSMMPMGDHKGASLALMIELLAVGLSGGHFGFEGYSLLRSDGESPRNGHLVIAIDPSSFIGLDSFHERIETLLSAVLEQEGAMIPGQDRQQSLEAAHREGLLIPGMLYQDLVQRAA